MLHTTCLRTAAALVQCVAISRRARTWGRFAQRTIDRRYCGLPFIPGPAAVWFATAVRLAGGRPSAHCWQPFGQPAAPDYGSCLWCGGPLSARAYCPCSPAPAHV